MKKMNKAGFTLVEIMIVVAIIGLLAAIGIPSFIRAREKSLANTKTANIKQVEGAIAQFAMDNGSTNNQLVTWANITAYLKDTAEANYTVATKALNSSTYIVGGSVSYVP